MPGQRHVNVPSPQTDEGQDILFRMHNYVSLPHTLLGSSSLRFLNPAKLRHEHASRAHVPETEKNMINNFTSLQPREFQKLRSRTCNWIERFASLLPTPLSLLDLLVETDVTPVAMPSGCVVLNGGVLAGCTPYDVKRVLRNSRVIPEGSGSEKLCYYGPLLPFLVVDAPMATPAGSGDSPLLSWARDIDGTRHSCQGGSAASSSCVLTKRVPAGVDGAAFSACFARLWVLPLPPDAQVKKPGSSNTSAPGYLLLLPCRVRPVLQAMRRDIQRPAIGCQELLAAPLAVPRGYEPHHDGPRRLRTERIAEIPGLLMVRNFLTPEEHDAILEELQGNRASLKCQPLARRSVAHFNRRFVYGKNQLVEEGDDVNARPSFYKAMRARLNNSDPGVLISGPYPVSASEPPCDQLTVNYYHYDGAAAPCGIAPHVDTHSALMEHIFAVSLGSHTVMDFACHCGSDPPESLVSPFAVYVPPRSLIVMTGECRYGWTHGIAERRADTLCENLPTVPRGNRVSLTWRRGRDAPHLKAQCPNPLLCDGI